MELSRRTFLSSASALAFLSASGAEARFPHGFSSGFHTLPIGGGGYLVGMSMSADGSTKLVRTDTQGAYKLNGANVWQQIITETSMGANANAGGVYEICVAPSNANIVYMMFRGQMFKSTDGCANWQLLSEFTAVTVESNGTFRYCGRKIAVDPNDPTKVYVGTDSNGVWVTSNGGAAWTQLSTASIPISTTVNGAYPGHQIVFVSSSIIYIASYGSQIRVSTDSGANWTPTTSGPTTTIHLVAASNGNVWAVTYDATQSQTNNLWRYNGAWSQQSVGMNMWAVAADPSDPTHIVVQHPAGALGWTNTGTAGTPTWTLTSASPPLSRNAVDIPWLVLAGAAGNTIATGDLQFDPVVSGKLWCNEGTGVWNAASPTLAATQVAWTSITKGIEQLVSQDIVHAPGGSLFYVCQDRGVFRQPSLTVYPSTNWSLSAFGAGYAFDYAMNNSNFGVATIFGGGSGRQNAKTSDGGQNWVPITDPTGTTVGGCIAVSTSLNWVLAPSNNPQHIYYTKDGGATWFTAGITTTPDNGGLYGWQWALFNRSRIVDADRNTANKFYAYCYLADNSPGVGGTGGGVYVSTNSGDTWTRIYVGPLDTATSFGCLKSIPGVPGQLLFSPQADGQSVAFMRLTDDGLGTSTSLTKTVISSIASVRRFGFGKSPQEQTYPTVFASTDATSAAGAPGVYRSDDNCVTWTLLLPAHPLDSTDVIVALDGDKDVYGRCYVGFGGSGAVYYTL